MEINTKVKLNNNLEMPILGFGTWKLEDGEETENAVLHALKSGYRHIDTATFYGNEESIGRAIKKSGIKREKIFVTTKLWNDDHDYAERAFQESLKRLELDYIDLYLIHWPVQGKRKESWKVLEELYKQGKCKTIGVSNYTIGHLEELFGFCKVVPAVNQVEFNVFLYQKELLEFCESKNIQLEAYCPLARAGKLKDQRLLEISKKYSKTPAQLMLRWLLQHNVVAIPKSMHKERIEENSNLFDFEISKKDMELLDGLNENYRVCWNPEEMD